MPPTRKVVVLYFTGFALFDKTGFIRQGEKVVHQGFLPCLIKPVLSDRAEILFTKVLALFDKTGFIRQGQKVVS